MCRSDRGNFHRERKRLAYNHTLNRSKSAEEGCSYEVVESRYEINLSFETRGCARL